MILPFGDLSPEEKGELGFEGMKGTPKSCLELLELFIPSSCVAVAWPRKREG